MIDLPDSPFFVYNFDWPTARFIDLQQRWVSFHQYYEQRWIALGGSLADGPGDSHLVTLTDAIAARGVAGWPPLSAISGLYPFADGDPINDGPRTYPGHGTSPDVPLSDDDRARALGWACIANQMLVVHTKMRFYETCHPGYRRPHHLHNQYK